MRAGVIILASLALCGGCANRKPAPVPASTLRQDALASYEERAVASLAFDPPVTLDGPRVELARAPREASAFVGFEQTTTTFFYVRMDDRQTEDGRHDRLERRAISVRFGSSYR